MQACILDPDPPSMKLGGGGGGGGGTLEPQTDKYVFVNGQNGVTLVLAGDKLCHGSGRLYGLI